jgi:hypothetical protein
MLVELELSKDAIKASCGSFRHSTIVEQASAGRSDAYQSG